MAEVILTMVCDDIRHEAGKKLSYMGVYDGSIRVANFPFIFQKLAFAQKWKNLKGLRTFRLEVRAEGSAPILVQGEIEVPTDRKVSVEEMVGQFLIHLNNLKVDRPGVISFTTYFNESPKDSFTHRVKVEQASPDELV